MEAPRAAGPLVERWPPRWPGAGHFHFFLSAHVFWRKGPPFAPRGALGSSMCQKVAQRFAGPISQAAADFSPGGGRFSELVHGAGLQRREIDRGLLQGALEKRWPARLDQLHCTKQPSDNCPVEHGRRFGGPTTSARHARRCTVGENTTVARAAVLFQIVCARRAVFTVPPFSKRLRA